MPRILALDPGTTALGWALFDTRRGLVDSGTRKLKGNDVDDRCELARQELITLLPAGCDVDVVALEKMFSAGHNSDAPLAVIAYLIRRRAKVLGIAVVEIAISTWKKRVVGAGNASKAESRIAAEERFGRRFASQDEADAACIALAAVEEIEVAS